MEKKGKKALSLLLALVLVLGMLPVTALATDSDFIIENGVLTDYTGPGGAVTIPDGVTSIGFGALGNCTNRDKLTSVIIPNSVTSIGKSAFSYCANLTSVNIPNSVTSIGHSAFSDCTSLTSVNIPNSVTSIGGWAFQNCTGLTSITIPSSVTSFEGNMFSGCTGLTAIQIDSNHQMYTSVDGVVFTRDIKTLVAYPAGKKGAYTIPDSVTTIGKQAFLGCTGLTSVVIPSSVTDIGQYESGAVYYGSTGTFEGCTGLTSVKIPNSVTLIGAHLFSDCTSLTSVTIPNSVTSIGNSAFSGTGLTSVNIPNSVTSIGEYAFFNCKGLVHITIPDSITAIKDRTFSHCSALTSVTIPNSVTSIGYEVFYECASMKDVYYGGTEAQWKKIEIGRNNDPLLSASIHYNSTGPDQSTIPDQPSNLPTVEKIPAAGTAVARTQTVKLDGKDVQFQYYAIKDTNGNESNYVKIRDLAQALNGTKAQFNVGWNGKISITSNTPYQAAGGEGSTPYSGNQPYTSVSDTPVSFNGSSVNLTSFSITYQGGGYTYYKLRDLGQLLNFNVKWDGGVVIETDKPYTGK